LGGIETQKKNIEKKFKENGGLFLDALLDK
jgi:hypothetical protein